MTSIFTNVTKRCFRCYRLTADYTFDCLNCISSEFTMCCRLCAVNYPESFVSASCCGRYICHRCSVLDHCRLCKKNGCRFCLRESECKCGSVFCSQCLRRCTACDLDKCITCSSAKIPALCKKCNNLRKRTMMFKELSQK